METQITDDRPKNFSYTELRDFRLRKKILKLLNESGVNQDVLERYKNNCTSQGNKLTSVSLQSS